MNYNNGDFVLYRGTLYIFDQYDINFKCCWIIPTNGDMMDYVNANKLIFYRRSLDKPRYLDE